MTGRRASQRPPEAPCEPDHAIPEGEEPNGANALPEPLPRRRVRLDSLMRLRLEATAIYREGRDGERPVGDATRLVYVLHTIARMMEGGEMEARLAEVERKLGRTAP